MKKYQPFFTLIFIFVVSCALNGSVFITPSIGAARKLLRPKPIYKKIAAITAQVLPGIHLEKHPVDDELSKRAFKIFLESLDYNKCIFLKQDIEALEKFSTRLDDMLKTGSISFGFKTYELYLRRFRQRVAFVEKQLKKGFDLTIDEKYNWDRKESEWPANEAEVNELWRKRLKNEYIAEVLIREDREKKKKKKEAKKEKNKQADETQANEAQDDETQANETQANETQADETQADDKSSDEKSLEEKEKEAKAAEKKLLEEKFDLTPVEAILKRYKQQRTILEDNDGEWVLQVFLSSFVRSLDPHSSYMSPSEEKDFDISMKLSLFGIGALLSPDEGTAKVVRLIPGGPALKDGRLKPGDRIIGVGQGDEPIVNTLHWPLNKAVKLIRGPKGTKVVLLVRKASEITGPPEKIDIIRAEVKLEEQAAKGTTREISVEVKENDKIVERKKKIAIINLPAFYLDFSRDKAASEKKSSTRDVREIIEKHKKEGLDGIIVDLRSNGGGSLQEAVSMTGLFIESGPVVQVKQSTGFLQNGIQVLKDQDNNVIWDGPLVILISRASASASEIFAGAIKDYNRGIIVGDFSTHGKGSVQTIYPVNRFVRAANDEPLGSLKVTMAMFYRINGESTQRKGVRPHINIPSVFETMDMGEDKQDYALPFDVIPPAEYFDLKAVDENFIGRIKILSDKRRAENPQFKLRKDLLEKITKRNKDKVIALNLDKRRTQREVEHKLVEEQERLSKEAMGQGDEDEQVSDDKEDKKSDEKNDKKLDDKADKDDKIDKDDKTDKDDKVDKKSKKTKDLVLEESINIIGDMIKYKRGSI